MNAVFDWLASLKWAIIAGLLSSRGACGKPGPGRAEMSGCSTEETSWLNNKQSQEASMQRDTASCFGGTTQKKHSYCFIHLVRFWEIRLFITFHYRIVAVIGNQSRSTLGAPLKNPPWLRDDGMCNELPKHYEDPHKAPFTAAHIQPLSNTWVLSLLRTALPVSTVLCCSPRMHKIYKHVFMCSWMYVYVGIYASGGRAGRLEK